MADRLRAMNLAQQWSLGVGLFFVVTGVVGFAVNSDFSTGSRATSSWFLVDWNGWHALSTELVALPLLVGAFVRKLAVPLAIYVGAVLVLTAVWALFDATPYGLFDFKHRASDVVLHLVSAAPLLTVAFIQIRRDRVGSGATAPAPG